MALRLRAHKLEAIRAGHVVLFMNDILEQGKTGMNEHIALHNLTHALFDMKHMYRDASVLFNLT